MTWSCVTHLRTFGRPRKTLTSPFQRNRVIFKRICGPCLLSLGVTASRVISAINHRNIRTRMSRCHQHLPTVCAMTPPHAPDKWTRSPLLRSELDDANVDLKY
ncbi:hypothetical protein AVEN_131075-1 [Araneus ventricosus]|uniref:Uncharacterized protein n=1 Tax=Araneus ventricosus TaxID=182803 RepID=A0A4Y2D313_ARAVE|nr:hypothetical protein AVEN_131075-1 [Araneus ventricosus]